MTTGECSTMRSRLAKGLGAQGYAQAVQVLIRLIEVPLLLGCWGTRLYGEWLMLAAIPSYLSMCDGGFAGAASREMSIRCGGGDRPGALSVFQSTWLLLLLVSAPVALLAVLGVQSAPLHEWLGFKEMDADTVKWVILILFLQVLVGFQTGLVFGGYYCEGRYAMGMALYVTLQLMSFGGMALAVAFGGGPVWAASGHLGGQAAGLVLMRLGLYRANPWLRYGLRGATLAEVRRLAAPAFASLAFPLGTALNIQGIWLIVGLVLGPPAVVVVTVVRTLSRLAMQPTAIISRLIEPELAAAYGGNRQEDFRSLFTRSCQAAIWTSIALCIVFGVSGKWILDLWTDGKIAMDWPLYSLFLLSVAVNSVWYTALMAAYATNRHVSVALAYSAVYGGMAIALAFLLLKLMGISGAGLSIFLSELVMSFFALPKMLRLAGESFASWAAKVMEPPWFLIRTGRDAGTIRG